MKGDGCTRGVTPRYGRSTGPIISGRPQTGRDGREGLDRQDGKTLITEPWICSLHRAASIPAATPATRLGTFLPPIPPVQPFLPIPPCSRSPQSRLRRLPNIRRRRACVRKPSVFGLGGCDASKLLQRLRVVEADVVCVWSQFEGVREDGGGRVELAA